MFRLSFAFAAIAVLSLINFYSYKRFLKRLDLFFKIQGVIKWVMIAITLCEICYFLVLRLDNLDPILYTLFSAMIGVSFMLFCVAILYDLFHIPYAKIPHDYSRRLFIKMVFDVTMLILAFSYIAKGFLNGMKAPRIKEVDVFIDGLESELSIVQITDVHIGKTLGKSFMDAVVKQVNALDADMVVITGDLIDMPVNQIGDNLTLCAPFRVVWVFTMCREIMSIFTGFIKLWSMFALWAFMFFPTVLLSSIIRLILRV